VIPLAAMKGYRKFISSKRRDHFIYEKSDLCSKICFATVAILKYSSFTDPIKNA
jgi:hypothetical protein